MYLMIIPPLVWLAIFNYWPLYGLVIAFQDFSITQGYLHSPWVGLKHFIYLFSKEAFRNAFRNTWVINLLRIAIGFPVPVIFALMLNEVRHEGYKRVVQTITYLPHFISWVVLAVIFNSLLARDTGAINRLLEAIGLVPVDFLQSNRTFRGVLIATDIWKEFGWETIIYLSTLASIDPELYEAATVDGAGRGARTWYITIPSLVPTILVVLLLRMGYILSMGFEQIYNLYNPLVYESGDIIQTYIVRMLEERPYFSRLAAAGFISSVIGFLLVMTSNRLIRIFGREGIY